MSANSLGLTLDGLPRTRMGGGGHFQSFLAAVMEAVKAGCEAEAEYRRHVARGIEPSEAAAAAFHMRRPLH